MPKQPLRPAPGFTLIELLVVLVIVGVIMAFAAVNFGESDGKKLERQGEQLALLLETARDEAIASGEMLGWSVTAGQEGQRWQFWRRNAQGQWQELADNEALRSRSLADGVVLYDVRVNLQPLPAADKLAFMPSGVNAPFRLELKLAEARLRLAGDVMGRLSVSRPDAAAPAGGGRP